jgi:hypothetical protein
VARCAAKLKSSRTPPRIITAQAENDNSGTRAVALLSMLHAPLSQHEALNVCVSLDMCASAERDERTCHALNFYSGAPQKGAAALALSQFAKMRREKWRAPTWFIICAINIYVQVCNLLVSLNKTFEEIALQFKETATSAWQNAFEAGN